MKKYIIAAGLMAAALSGRAQSTFNMQFVCDNDFAVFAGTSTGVTSLLYQNDYSWPDQLSSIASLNFTLQPGEDTFYVLGMGGGGNENIAGAVNEMDIQKLSVLMSSDITPFLAGYADDGYYAPAGGIYNASLADVQSAFGELTWGSPAYTTEADNVANGSPWGGGYHFDDSTAHLFKFSATSVGVEVAPVPEPTTMTMLALGGIGGLLLRRRK